MRPTTIFAANDLMAIGAIRALREAGLGIPDDMDAAGFDDIPATRLLSPALTTVAQFQHDVGRRAAEVLMAQLQGGSPGTESATKMPFSLTEWQST